MISVTDAKKLIVENCLPTNKIEINIQDSFGFALADDIFSPIDFPSFRQSAMDGYAIRFDDLATQKSFEIQTEIQAGDNSSIVLEKGKAIRIFTGAKVPDEADTVIQQEATDFADDTDGRKKLIINHLPLIINQNIRAFGSQTKKGNLVLQKGTKITPATVSLLANLGISKITVFQKPTICILNTGKELLKQNEPLQEGKVYESNSFSLVFALQEMGFLVNEINWVDDTLEATFEAIKNAISIYDFILLTGGVSVGDYDFVLEALQQNNAKIIFHKIKQKPGKPLLFAKKDNKIIFGLPGNPASVLTCFYLYVYVALKKLMGFNQTELQKIQSPLINSYSKKAGLTHFVKAIVSEQGVEILDHQESYKMNSFAVANSLVEIDAEKEYVKNGELVKVYLL